jgi:hypothetical protein
VNHGSPYHGPFWGLGDFSLAFGCAARKARCVAMLSCITGAGFLVGCATNSPAVVAPPGGGLPAPGPSRDTAVPPDSARILANAPPGGRLRYRLLDGTPVVLVLGPVYESGLLVPCRVGHASGAGLTGDSPRDYVFCQQGDRWYAMPPVVVSGS